MPKLFSSVWIVKVLRRKGFVFISQKGSHAKFKHGRYSVIIPMGRKEIPFGTLKSILRQANLSEDDFKK
ncbi:MAG: type II toxin-antitoxin system HicA family toxin [bacterium]|nr:type II toxin-antitoxin system HicA family toxin [bacterium]